MKEKLWKRFQKVIEYGPEKSPYLDTFQVVYNTISLVLYLYINSKVVCCQYRKCTHCILKCTCNLTYFGEAKGKVLTRTTEHQEDSFKGKWDNSGTREHTLLCHG